MVGLQTAALTLFAAFLAAAGSSSTLVSVLAVLSPIVAAGLGAYLTWRLRQVHTLVNNTATVQDRRIGQLVAALETAGIAVPDTTQQTGPA
jgi:hypothetical protein